MSLIQKKSDHSSSEDEDSVGEPSVDVAHTPYSAKLTEACDATNATRQFKRHRSEEEKREER
eukprot:CAMPEP_0183313004 /NCGR_PEP_ID=MMETSP0160_2-20130417/43805_1 /TAXON_ID=2839 ORGANISM="Odontella Sinensis, Strain Grunow 1884" /NCGR_SAMPLE_ID=MMETSP0160_2 /ASSEMBLY_ACC=CAM_ASM_000250 /LENGTH=61 /DNA_ID=CAMNT_0025477993 /DNA_START=101 /DNA_END=283 /DNA_ORIENTATION=-